MPPLFHTPAPSWSAASAWELECLHFKLLKRDCMGLGNWVFHLRRKMRVSLQEGDEEEANLISVQLDPLGANNSQKCHGSCNKFFHVFSIFVMSKWIISDISQWIHQYTESSNQSINEWMRRWMLNSNFLWATQFVGFHDLWMFWKRHFGDR